MTVADVLSKLKEVKGSGPWTALCPVHDDERRSLSISKGRDGRVLLNCHAGCSFASIAARVGLKAEASNIVAEYDYCDERGTLLYQAVRFEPKDFRLRRPDGAGGWIWKADVERVPFNLPALLRAIARGKMVCFVEGEKDVLSLASIGLTATTIATGAKAKIPLAFPNHFKGARVAILPDNDEPGRAFAYRIAKALNGVASEIRVVELPGLDAKGDVSNWLSADGTREELRALIYSAPIWTSSGSPASSPEPTSSERERLRLEAAPNGKARTPVKFWSLDGKELTPVSAIDLLSLTARRRVVAELPEELRTEGEKLLEQVAIQVMRDRASGVHGATEEPENQSLDVEPWAEEVNGATLLDELSLHIREYVHLSRESADAVATWCVLTHLADSVMFAPLLAIESASKRCGKSVLLSIVSHIVRRGRLTSAGGITPAVLFRLNERDHPTLCLDEAEKLQGRHADPELLSLVNVGYRRGSKVFRCAEKSGAFDIVEFDAFGFRALALIGAPWDTIADRSVIIELERKPREAKVQRFIESAVETQGREFARRIRRWTEDRRDEIVGAIAEGDRPLWLGDRDCDNWSGLFAVASVAGGEWPQRIATAARSLAEGRQDDGDDGELLIHDVQAVFSANGNPCVIQSTDICEKLNAIEESGWGNKRDGRGLNPHDLARRLKPFKVRPRAARHTVTGVQTRGYWLSDLSTVFARYPTRPAPGTVVAALAGDAGNTVDEMCNTSSVATAGVAPQRVNESATLATLWESVGASTDDEDYEAAERDALVEGL